MSVGIASLQRARTLRDSKDHIGAISAYDAAIDEYDEANHRGLIDDALRDEKVANCYELLSQTYLECSVKYTKYEKETLSKHYEKRCNDTRSKSIAAISLIATASSSASNSSSSSRATAPEKIPELPLASGPSRKQKRQKMYALHNLVNFMSFLFEPMKLWWDISLCDESKDEKLITIQLKTSAADACLDWLTGLNIAGARIEKSQQRQKSHSFNSSESADAVANQYCSIVIPGTDKIRSELAKMRQLQEHLQKISAIAWVCECKFTDDSFAPSAIVLRSMEFSTIEEAKQYLARLLAVDQNIKPKPIVESWDARFVVVIYSEYSTVFKLNPASAVAAVSPSAAAVALKNAAVSRAPVVETESKGMVTKENKVIPYRALVLYQCARLLTNPIVFNYSSFVYGFFKQVDELFRRVRQRLTLSDLSKSEKELYDAINVFLSSVIKFSSHFFAVATNENTDEICLLKQEQNEMVQKAKVFEKIGNINYYPTWAKTVLREMFQIYDAYSSTASVTVVHAKAAVVVATSASAGFSTAAVLGSSMAAVTSLSIGATNSENAGASAAEAAAVVPVFSS